MRRTACSNIVSENHPCLSKSAKQILHFSIIHEYHKHGFVPRHDERNKSEAEHPKWRSLLEHN